MRKIYQNALIGLGYGYLTATATINFFAKDASGLEVRQMYLLWIIPSMLYGIISMVYDNENLSKLKSNLIHGILGYTVTVVTIYIMFEKILYLDINLEILRYSLLFIVVWLIIHGINFFIEKMRIKNINEILKGK